MGRVPIPPPPRPSILSREETNLGLLREAYARDQITLDELEAATTHVLRGGMVNADGRYGIVVNGERIDAATIPRVTTRLNVYEILQPFEIVPDEFFARDRDR